MQGKSQPTPALRSFKPPPQTKGYLKKQSEGGWGVWRRRWFVLRDNRLYYFKEEKGTTVNVQNKRGTMTAQNAVPIGYIDLRDAKHVGHYVDETSTPMPGNPAFGGGPASPLPDKTQSSSDSGVIGRGMTISLGKAFSLQNLWDPSRYFFVETKDHTYWFFGESKEEVDMWVDALIHSKRYYESREREENHMKQIMEIGFSWSKPFVREPKPEPRSGHSLVAVGKYMFLFGGYSKAKECALGDLYVFCTKTSKWRKPDIVGIAPSPRYGHSCIAIEKDLFIFGGLTRTGRTNELWILNTKTLTWTQQETKGTVPTPRDAHTATLLPGRKIIVVGGLDVYTKHKCGGVYILDTKTLEWTKCVVDAEHLKLVEKSNSIIKAENKSNFIFSILPSGDPVSPVGSPLKREKKGEEENAEPGIQAATGDEFYDEIIDGFERMASVNEEDPDPSRIAYHSAVYVNERLFLFGGYNGTKCTNDVWVLNINGARMKWEKPMVSGVPPPPMEGHSAVMLGTRMLIFGGWNKRGQSFKELYFFDTKTLIWFKAFSSGEPPLSRWSSQWDLEKKTNAVYLFAGWNGREDFGDVHVLTCRHLELEWQLHFDQNIPDNACCHCKQALPEQSVITLMCGKVIHNKCVGFYVDWCLTEGLDPVTHPFENKIESEPEMLLDYISSILCSANHPISKNIAAFVHQFELQYGVESPDVRTLNFETSQQRLTEETLHRAANEVRAYVQRLHALILSKFKLLDSQAGKQECLSAINRILLPKVYDVIFRLYVDSNTVKQSQYEQRLMVLKNASPADFHLNELFALSFGNIAPLLDRRLVASAEKEQEKAPENPSTTAMGVLASPGRPIVTEASDAVPRVATYENSVRLLRRLGHYQTPYAKLDCLVLMRHCLNFSVARYWMDFVASQHSEKTRQKDPLSEKESERIGVKHPTKDRPLQGEDLVLTADDLVALFSLLVVKAQVRNMYAEMDFINQFADEGLLTGDGAYCLTTLQVALEAVEKMVDTAEFKEKMKKDPGYKLDMDWLHDK